MVPALRSGELATRPLPGLLLDLHDGGVNGCLTLRRAGMVKSIDLADGELVRVTSSLRDETLGHYLVQRGAITEGQHRAALDHAAPAQARLGETLVNQGVISGDALRRHVVEQDRQKVVSALRWPHGTWRFDVQVAPRRPAEGLWMPEIVARGLWSTSGQDPDRLARFDGGSVELTARGRSLVSLWRAVFGAAIAEALARGGAVASLEAACGDELALRRALDVLVWCGAATLNKPLRGERPAPSVVPAEPAGARGVSVERSAPSVAQGEPSLPRGVAPRRSDPALGAIAAKLAQQPAAPSTRPHNELRAPAPANDPVAPASSRAPTRREPWAPRGPTGEAPAVMPRTITSVARSRAFTPWAAAVARTVTNPLYDLLFDEHEELAAEGAVPLELAEGDSGVISTAELGAASLHGDAAAAARSALIAEAERIHTADLYTVLLLERTATAEQIVAAVGERHAELARLAQLLGPSADRPRLDEVRAIYESARSVLLDDEARSQYDRALDETRAQAPGLDAELLFADIEELLVQHRFAEAIVRLQQLVARAPAQADFHEALGWAHWLHKGPSQHAGELARPHLGRALQIDPDHVAAHVHRGIIGASLGEDDAEVLFHLERALELRPARADALEHLAPILLRRGELRRLERLYKRLLFRTSASYPRRVAELWLDLAQLYAYHLDDAAAAESAAEQALRVAGEDAAMIAAAARLRAVCERPLHPLEPARARLRRTRDVASASALIEAAREVGQPDSAFVTAATMVALGEADAKMRQAYEQHRVQRPELSPTPLTEVEWQLVRDPDDVPELVALVELVAPVVSLLSPVTLATAEVDVAMRVTDAELPASFRRVRDLVAAVLGVTPCPVYARPELDRQIQLVATDPPILVAGDEALTAPERPELVCRLARALCHASPGRAVGGSRPGRVLRAALRAVVRDATSSPIGEEDALAAEASAALEQLPRAARLAARAAAQRLLARRSELNLSRWSRALASTADRVGVVLSQDIPTALAIAKESGVLTRSLIEFSFGPEHVALRTSLGLSVCR